MENSDPSVGLCSQVVLDLMAGLEKQGHELYTDNYYTSPQLFQSLYDKGINACGTALTNRRYFPQDLVYKRKQHKCGFYDYRSYWQWYGWTSITYTLSLFYIELTSGDPTTAKRRQLGWHPSGC